MITCGKLEEGSEQRKRLPRLVKKPKCEVRQILGEIVSTESVKSPERARAVLGRCEDISPRLMFWWKLAAGRRSCVHNSARMIALREMTDGGDDFTASSKGGGVGHL